MPRPAWGRVAGCCRRAALLLPLLLLPLAPSSSDEQAAPSAGKPSTEAGKLPGYADNGSCVLCHEDVVTATSRTLHGAILARRETEGLARNCQTCHGPSEKHLDDPAGTKPPWVVSQLGRRASGQMCLHCHKQQIPPITWRTSDHYTGKVQCWDCHSRVRPAKAHSEYVAKPPSGVCAECHREVEGLFRLNSHHPVSVEQRIECSDCHKPHGRIRDRDVVESCRGCHTARRGPFIFEHGAISSRLMGGCTECHNPHGSPNQDLLRFNGRGVCLQCHADKLNHFPGPVCWACHRGHHGSNSTPLLFDD